MIRLVVALREEAMPLVQLFELTERQPPGLFAVFSNDEVMLTVCGVGRHQAAAAVAYLHALGEEAAQGVWLNVGIAGHRSQPPGTLLVASRIVAGERNWYPPLQLLGGWRCSELVCVDEPETSYPREALYDMESAGFYSIARRCSTAELVHCVKVVSDGPQHDIGKVTGSSVTRLIEDASADVARLASELDTSARELRNRMAPHPQLEQLVSGCRASVTQRHQLAVLLQRWQVLAPEQPLLEHALAAGTRPQQVIDALRTALDNLPVRLGV